MSLQQAWNLEVIFPGGSSSSQFAAFLKQIEQATADFLQLLEHIEVPTTIAAGEQQISPLLERFQANLMCFREAESFSSCLMAERMDDKKAVQLSGQVKSAYADFLSALTRFDEMLRQISDEVWQGLSKTEALQTVIFALDERRSLAGQKLPPEQ